MINVAIVGFGYWGPNLVRNFLANPSTNASVICDRDGNRQAKAASLYPSARITGDFTEVLKDNKIDVVAIATPVHTHYDLALAALEAGKHVLVEKPITENAKQAQHLVDVAAAKNLVLMVDHTLVYSGAVRKIHEVVRSDDFGKLHYYDSTRVNLGLFQTDVNVLWDLAVHDLAIMSHVIGEVPREVSAVGHTHLAGQPEYAAYLTVFFDSVIAHINVNWLSPVKIRRALVGGSNKLVVFDDLDISDKVKIYDKGVSFTQDPDNNRKMMVSYRTGSMWSPKIDETESLALEVRHMVDCIENKSTPLAGGVQGLELIKILEAADKSLAGRGAPVKIV